MRRLRSGGCKIGCALARPAGVRARDGAHQNPSHPGDFVAALTPTCETHTKLRSRSSWAFFCPYSLTKQFISKQGISRKTPVATDSTNLTARVLFLEEGQRHWTDVR